jgi:hypothetical protein
MSVLHVQSLMQLSLYLLLLLHCPAVVSDFGNGGQVVMDHVTFAAVKESLTVLGAVEAAGINYTRLATHRSLWTTLKVMLGCTR